MLPSPTISEICDYDAIILGAGVSGLVSASILAKQGASSILIIEEYERLGGNHIDFSVGSYTFDVGSLIFQDDSPLLEHFPELLPAYVPIKPQWARLNPQGLVTDYPISIRDDILRSGIIGIARVFGSLLWARLFQRRISNARDFARYWIGAHLLHRSGLETYMYRLCGVPLEEVDVDLAQKRMQWISDHACVRKQLRRLIQRSREGKRAAPCNRQLARPKAGFSQLYQLARDNLEKRGVQFSLGAKPLSVERVDDRLVVTLSDRIVSAQRLISTIPIERAQTLCGIPVGRALETITLISLYFSFKGDRGFVQSILYNFTHEGAWKRLTVYSDFYGPVDGREYFAVEVVGNQVGNCVDDAEKDFLGHAQANSLFQGELKLEGSHVLHHAYPLYRRDAVKRAAEAVASLRALGVESHGRHGGFNYQPTARVSTRDAEAALAWQ